jgi:hypothetical protein
VGRERRMPVVPAHAQGNSFPSSSWPELLLLPSILRISSVHWGSLRHWLLGRIKNFLGGLLFLIFWDLEVAWLAPELPKFLCQSLIFFHKFYLIVYMGKIKGTFPDKASISVLTYLLFHLKFRKAKISRSSKLNKQNLF